MAAALQDRSATRPWDESGWRTIPSWFVSLLFHAGLYVALIYALPKRVDSGGPGEQDREVGLYTSASQQEGPPGQGNGSGSGESSEAIVASSQAPESNSLQSQFDGPPVELDLPPLAAQRIGPGPPQSLHSGATAKDLVKPSRAGASGIGNALPGGGGGGGGGGTSFFGTKGTGSRFVYVLDASGSMYEHNAIAVAKAELLASLAQLDDTHQFQVIFYNERVFPMVGAGGKQQLFWGNESSRSLASQFIRSVQPDGGTRHLIALEAALAYAPEVLFFLTDAGEPILTSADLNTITKRNNGRTTIHTFEFGKGANLSPTNFLTKLSRENGGKHVYKDVTQFRRE